jgi:hypothetical protein
VGSDAHACEDDVLTGRWPKDCHSHGRPIETNDHIRGRPCARSVASHPAWRASDGARRTSRGSRRAPQAPAVHRPVVGQKKSSSWVMLEAVPLTLGDGHHPHAWVGTGSVMAIATSRSGRRAVMAIGRAVRPPVMGRRRRVRRYLPGGRRRCGPSRRARRSASFFLRLADSRSAAVASRSISRRLDPAASCSSASPSGAKSARSQHCNRPGRPGADGGTRTACTRAAETPKPQPWAGGLGSPVHA